MKKEKNVETNINEANETEVTKESKAKTFGSKIKSGFKKHGKKVGAVALTATVGLIGYMIGSHKNKDNDDFVIDGSIDSFNDGDDYSNVDDSE